MGWDEVSNKIVRVDAFTFQAHNNRQNKFASLRVQGIAGISLDVRRQKLRKTISATIHQSYTLTTGKPQSKECSIIVIITFFKVKSRRLNARLSQESVAFLLNAHDIIEICNWSLFEEGWLKRVRALPVDKVVTGTWNLLKSKGCKSLELVLDWTPKYLSSGRKAHFEILWTVWVERETKTSVQCY